METTAIDRKTKSRVLSFRVTEETARAMKTLTKFRGTTDADFLQRALQPFETLGNVAELEELRVAIQRSVESKEGVELQGEQAEWGGVDVLSVGTLDKQRFVHTVRVYEGQTAEEAVADYVERLFKVARIAGKYWRELTTPAHVYKLGFVGFSHWRRFGNVEQYDLWRKYEDKAERKDPETPIEWAVYGWCMENLPGWYERSKLGTLSHEDNVKDPDWLDHDIAGVVHLNVLPDMSFEECVRDWARIVVATVKTESDPEGLVERLENFAFMFTELRIEPERKLRRYVKKGTK